MFNYIKKLWMHPLTDAIIIVGLIALVLILGVAKATSADANPSRHHKPLPLVSITDVMKNAGCTKVYGVGRSPKNMYLSYKNFTCKAGHWELFGENYTSLKRQARDITNWEYEDAEEGVKPFWFVRCPGYNLTTTESVGINFSKQYVKKHPECRAQRIDGATYSRKVS